MVTRDGFAKILDFGLAKLVLPEIGGRAGEPGAALPGDRIMAVPVNATPSFRTGAAAPLFRASPSRFEFGGSASTLFDVSPDGTRILVNRFDENQGSPPLTLVVDWQALTQTGAAGPR